VSHLRNAGEAQMPVDKNGPDAAACDTQKQVAIVDARGFGASNRALCATLQSKGALPGPLVVYLCSTVGLSLIQHGSVGPHWQSHLTVVQSLGK
jgi:hypothetical protein